MKRILLIAALAATLLSTAVTTASASIHPIVASFCAAVASSNPRVLDPPGQTPTSDDPNTWTVSNLRALQATGFLTLIRDANGNVIGFTVNEDLPAVKDFGFPAFVNCTSLNP